MKPGMRRTGGGSTARSTERNRRSTSSRANSSQYRSSPRTGATSTPRTVSQRSVFDCQKATSPAPGVETTLRQPSGPSRGVSRTSPPRACARSVVSLTSGTSHVGQPERVLRRLGALDHAARQPVPHAEREIGAVAGANPLRPPAEHARVEGQRALEIPRMQLEMDDRVGGTLIHRLPPRPVNRLEIHRSGDEFRRSRRSTLHRRDEHDADTVDRGAERAARDRPQGERGRLRAAGRAAPLRAAGALLPHAGLGPGRRGRAPGGAGPRLEEPRQVRGPQLPALLALPDRHQHLARCDRAAAQADPADRLRPARRSARRRRRAARRVGLDRALPGRDPGDRGRLRLARRALRAARVRRARLHRGAAAAPGQPARGPHPPRGARLLRAGDGRTPSTPASPR